MGEINDKLLELNGLWVEMSPASLARIRALCEEIGRQTAEANNLAGEIDPVLMRRALILAAKARQRAVDCLTIQSRTGSYSFSGELEASPHVTTSGWEA